MQHALPGALTCKGPECPQEASNPAPIAAVRAAWARQQGIPQLFGGMNAPRRLRLIATVKNILRETLTILLIQKDFTYVKKI
ncbi:MAG: hypothetical protein ACYDFU_06040 [Nitrospirota bacterium]